jgi:2,5-diamino-6-(ribosylamino)-4(3H)-pyrimidinone 5'-phosphate reductase
MVRPRIMVNVAATADGKIDTVARKGAAISSIADKARVDRLRAGVDAVLVGGHTLLAEDPGLTVKSIALRMERKALGLPEYPAKVGIATEIPADKLPVDGAFLGTGTARTFVFTTHRTSPEVVARLRDARAEVDVASGERLDMQAVFGSLYIAGIRSVLVEGGGTTIAELFRLGLVDELTIYIAPLIFAGTSAPTLADGPGFLNEQAPRLRLISVEKFDAEGGVLLSYESDVRK